MSLYLRPPSGGILRGRIDLPTSKSECNRALIIRALSRGQCRVEGISSAKDSQTLARLLQESNEELDVGHAGTAMRFLTAYQAFQPRDVVLTGSERMQERPIGPLVEALREIGAEIHYMRKEGYPPLMVCGRNASFGASEVSIPGGVSSQYISALLMVAPTLPAGLRLTLTGAVRSRPYIEMTLRIMEHFGISSTWNGPVIEVPPQYYRPGLYQVEADWSSASYWYCLAALSQEAQVELEGLRPASWQGDSAIVELMEQLGVTTEWTPTGLAITKSPGFKLPDTLEWDFSPCPDLAQGVLATLHALGVRGKFVGLESLRIKETDRIAALQNELGKLGGQLKEFEQGGHLSWELSGTFQANAISVPTYQDHRMALAFAPLALRTGAITILEEEVIGKSYPHYWSDLEKVGFQMERH